ncbi:conserved hypothetical protein [Sporisorium reilianum SRZ2]|uniref:Uncharacterized protein n=1 Tax=Sporisorium reilianum (strain SRZ2) TaxID=999809 RepID=E6ZQ43_SPORE|nr:conserved hypothetical protein [Sporisorium reilianum SRZ2]
MSAKSPVKRGSMLGSLSVADRAKMFQNDANAATPAKPLVMRTSKAAPTSTAREALPSSSSSASASRSSPVHPASSEACASSSPAVLSRGDDHESVAVIKHARRISVSTPIHRRARSDVSVLDPFVGAHAATSNTPRRASQPQCTSAPTIRTTSFAEIEQLAASLDATRPRPAARRARASSVLMHSIAEENVHLRMCASTETIRGVAQPAAVRSDEHVRFHVSPCPSDDGSVDWHRFVSANYGVSAVEYRQPIVIADCELARKRVYTSRLCTADSPTLHDEATWLEEELANCSSDDEPQRSLDEDEYLTPDGSPLLSPVNVMAPPAVEILGLGIQDATLQLPGQAVGADKSADSLLEQVALHEACLRTLHTLSHDERDQAAAIASAVNRRQHAHAPAMPHRRSSLSVPGAALRRAGSSGDFGATQRDSLLFADDTYDASLSPMADLGHEYTLDTAERRASAASYLSTDSTASADVSVGSQASSLLYNAHLAAPRMHRAGSADTASTRPSSIASSCCHDKPPAPAPVKPPRSPLRSTSRALALATPQPAQRAASPARQAQCDVVRMQAMPLPALPADATARVRRQASRRRMGTDQPLPPARLDSLDTVVAAAPRETQLREEFPDRLLGAWMAAPASQAGDVAALNEHVSVEPVPLHERVRRDAATHVPASPDVAVDAIPVYPGAAARKRLGVDSLAPAATPPSRPSTTLKSKLSGRFGLSLASRDAASPAAELPAAWKERIGRPSLDRRRPSLTSLTAVPTERARSSLGLRKMLSSLTTSSAAPVAEPSAEASIQALAASTFESPRSARRASLRRERAQRRYESFMELSDDDDEEAVARRKDLTKVLGGEVLRPQSGSRAGW